MTDKPLLIRMDSGNDAAENLGILIEDGYPGRGTEHVLDQPRLVR